MDGASAIGTEVRKADIAHASFGRPMSKQLINILVCPQCLGQLKLRTFVEGEKGEIVRGRMLCENCRLSFVVEDGIPVFGVRAEKKMERYRELNAELVWEFTVNIQSHIKHAEKSALIGERIIQNIREKSKFMDGKEKKVLDLGAGVGALHSWQFSKHGFLVVATELCPEFLFSIDYFNNENIFFERVITDCTILPFRGGSFDIVFCKQLIHHIEKPLELLSEIWRVTRRNGLIAIEEPAISVFRNKNSALKKDRATKIGISHHYYRLNEFYELFEKIASNIEINPIPLEIQSLDRVLPKKIRKLLANYIRGSVELIGIKRRDFMQEEKNRKVIPIFTEKLRLDNLKMEHYRKKVIPSKLEIFRRTHEKCLKQFYGGGSMAKNDAWKVQRTKRSIGALGRIMKTQEARTRQIS